MGAQNLNRSRNGIFKSLMILTVTLCVAGVLIWAFLEGRAEMKMEREREKPIQVPSRVKRTDQGELRIVFDQRTRSLADIRTEKATGEGKTVLVPRSSLLRHEGKTFVYVEIAPNEFIRKKVQLLTPSSGGWLISQGVSPGEKTVSVGAQTLLSEELKSQIQVGDEGNPS